MNEQVLLLNMFALYQPSEPLQSVLSQAAVAAADIDPATKRLDVVVHSDRYIPQRILNQAAQEICTVYGLRQLDITATHPADQLTCIEPEELMNLFVNANSMTRGSLAGAAWRWDGNKLVVDLKTRGSHALMLEVRDSNGPAIALYEKLGFQQVGLRKNYYHNPKEHARILRKEWEI